MEELEKEKVVKAKLNNETVQNGERSGTPVHWHIKDIFDVSTVLLITLIVIKTFLHVSELFIVLNTSSYIFATFFSVINLILLVGLLLATIFRKKGKLAFGINTLI